MSGSTSARYLKLTIQEVILGHKWMNNLLQQEANIAGIIAISLLRLARSIREGNWANYADLAILRKARTANARKVSAEIQRQSRSSRPPL